MIPDPHVYISFWSFFQTSLLFQTPIIKNGQIFQPPR